MIIKFYNDRTGDATSREVDVIKVTQDHLWDMGNERPELIAVFSMDHQFDIDPDVDGWYLKDGSGTRFTDWWVTK